MKNKNEHINLKEEAPTLSQIQPKNNFKVDANYFDTFPNTIAEKVSKSKTVFNFFPNLKYAIPSIAIVFLGLFILLQKNNTQSVPLEIYSEDFYSSLTTEDEDYYLDMNIEFTFTEFNPDEYNFVEQDEFNYELPIETEEIELDIIF